MKSRKEANAPAMELIRMAHDYFAGGDHASRRNTDEYHRDANDMTITE